MYECNVMRKTRRCDNFVNSTTFVAVNDREIRWKILNYFYNAVNGMKRSLTPNFFNSAPSNIFFNKREIRREM